MAPLEQATAKRADARSARLLAMAYALSGEADKGLPLLTTYLNGAGAKDGPALAAGRLRALSAPPAGADVAAIAADRVQARTWARAYGADQRARSCPLVEAWAGFSRAPSSGTRSRAAL